MLKKIIAVVIVLIMCSGCNENNDTHVRKNIEDNPFNENILGEDENVEASFSFGINNYDGEKRVIDYKTGNLPIDVEFGNGEQDVEVGILIYIDGVPQKYSMDNGNNEKYIHPVKLEKNKTIIKKLNMEPVFGQLGDKHQLMFGCMKCPTYKPRENHEFGNNYHITPLLAWTINKDIKSTNVEFEKNKVINEFSEKEIGVLCQGDDYLKRKIFDVLSTNFSNNDELIENSEIKISNKNKFNIFGGEKSSYRLNAFINNEPANVFDGKSCAEVSIEKNKRTQLDISFNDINVNDNDVFYIIYSTFSGNEISDNDIIDCSNPMLLRK